MAAAGQTINDRILAAKHSLAGQGLAKAVCKATTEEIIGPKKKHLDYLLHCTNEPNVSIPTLANLLIERTQNPNWCVVYKALITIHHLMCYGNERFTQYLASSNSNFQLNNFLDKTGVQGYDMSPFIRRYAKYLSEKSVSYRTVAFDFCKVKRGKDGGTLRTMSGEKLLKTLPTLQTQVDNLLEFDCTSQDLNNGVINACFMLLFRDLIRLFACYNDGIINLLEKYFDMNKKQARDALDLYKKFLIRMDRVAEFLKVAENVGIDKGDIPDLAKAPSSLLEALEGHLASLEGRKPGSGGTTPTTGATRVNVAAAVNALSTTSSAFGTAANGSASMDEHTTQKLLEEEAAAMEKFRNSATATNPFAAAPESKEEKDETPNILDLFGCAAPPPTAAPVVSPAAPAAATSPANNAGKASDDLLQLAGNPFANMLNGAGGGGVSSAGPSVFPPAAAPLNPAMTAPGFPATSSGPFVTDNSFNNVFGSQPVASNAGGGGGAALFGDVMQPVGGVDGAGTNQAGKVITSDLDSSLANLASNLDFGPAANKSMVGVGMSRGPPMAQPPGFNPFPQQQQMAVPTPSMVSSSISDGSQAASGLTPASQLLTPANNSPFPGTNNAFPGMSSNTTSFPGMSQSASFHGISPSTPSFPGMSPMFPVSSQKPPLSLTPTPSSAFADFSSNNNNKQFSNSNPNLAFPGSNPFPGPSPLQPGITPSNDPFGLI
jgi:hypothetical protein